MDAKDAEAVYKFLVSERDAGRMSPAEFTEKVNDLRFQDNQGIWFQIRAEDGAWLWWTGNAWEPYIVPPQKIVQAPTPSSVPSSVATPLVMPAAAIAGRKFTGIVRFFKDHRVAVLSIILGILSFFIVPFVVGMIAIIAGLYNWREDKLGLIGVVIAIAGMTVDHYYVYLF